MAMAEKKKKRTGKILLLSVVFLLLAVVLILFVMPQVLYRLQADPESLETEMAAITEETRSQTESVRIPGTAVELPAMLEDGRLQIESLFQFDGINPDCENQEQEHIAAILVKNISGEFLLEAKIMMELSNGTQTSFVVTNLPAERAAMVFSAENSSIKEADVCVGIACEARWDEAAAIPEGVVVSAEGITITVTNQTAQDIPELTVYCHSLLGEDFFGGITYMYKIEDLSANETTVIEAPECIMGMAEVVRVAIT